MAIFYSAAAGAFFDDANHKTLPADAVQISATRHRALLNAQATGGIITASADGKPRIVRPRAGIAEQRARLVRQVKREAARRIDAVSPIWRQLNDSRAPSSEGAARFAAIDAIRAASNAIEGEVSALPAAAISAFAFAHHPLWPAE